MVVPVPSLVHMYVCALPSSSSGLMSPLGQVTCRNANIYNGLYVVYREGKLNIT